MNSIEGYVYIDRLPFIHTNLAKGLFILFMSYFAFGFDYEKGIKNLMLCLEKFVMKWPFDKASDPPEIISIGSKLTYF